MTTEPHSPWQNHAELVGGIIKRRVKNTMRRTNTPIVLWDYCWEFMAMLRSLTVTDLPILEGVTPYEKVHKYTPDIAEYVGFDWYQWVLYHDPKDPNKRTTW